MQLQYYYHINTLYILLPAPATTEIYTLSLHDALPIYIVTNTIGNCVVQKTDPYTPTELFALEGGKLRRLTFHQQDRKSTRLNSSHPSISYAVFCLKKKSCARSLHDQSSLTSCSLCSTF